MHAVCLWDDKGPAKIHQALKEDILEFIKQAQAVSSASLYYICFKVLLKEYYKKNTLNVGLPEVILNITLIQCIF